MRAAVGVGWSQAFGILVAFVSLGSPGALAQPSASPKPGAAETTAGSDADKKRATELYEQSRDLYREGRFAEAARLLEQAYALYPFPALLYNLARAREGLGEREAAATAYERYLEADPRVEDRKSIEARIANLRRTPVPAGSATTAPAPAASATSTAPPQPERGPSPLEGPAPWIVAGAGGLVATVGAVLLGAAFAVNASADDEATQIAAADGHDDAVRLHTASIVTLAVGGAALAVGLGLGIAGVAGTTSERAAPRGAFAASVRWAF